MNCLRSGKMPFLKADIESYIDRTARNVVQYLIGRQETVSTAESCTGGLLSSAITSVAGASAIFECGISAYSERIKSEVLGVPADTVKRFGVVSAQTAEAMAEGVMRLSKSAFSIGITGLAGSATEGDKLPVGTIYVSARSREETVTQNLELYKLGQFDRQINRLLTVGCALEMLQDLVKEGI